MQLQDAINILGQEIDTLRAENSRIKTQISRQQREKEAAPLAEASEPRTPEKKAPIPVITTTSAPEVSSTKADDVDAAKELTAAFDDDDEDDSVSML